jgi:HAD superfamily hydrolase (TIGR01509 family)
MYRTAFSGRYSVGMANLRALIFDVDGTLADTEELHRQAFNLTFAEFGLEWEWTPRLYEHLLRVSGGRERMHAYAESLGEAFHWPRNPSGYFRDLHRVKTAHYAKLLTDTNVPLRPGVHRLLEEASAQQLGLAIATSSAYCNVDTLLRKNLGADWAQRFDAIGTSDVVEDKKPSPAVYHYVLERLRLNARNTIAFEDTVNGNRAAQAAGLRVIITTHYYTRNDRFPGAALVVDQLGEPDQPFTPRAGDAHDATCVDLALLRELMNPRRDEPANVTRLTPVFAAPAT